MNSIAFVIVELNADAAFCVATPEVNNAIDRPTARSPLTREAIVPITSLMGGLRAHALTMAQVPVNELFGTRRGATDARREGSEQADGRSDLPTMIRGLGAEVRSRGNPISEVQSREQTAIDRQRGAAAAKSLRTSQMVPAGATVTMYLEVLNSDYLDVVLRILKSWRPTIGGGRSVGLGQATVTKIQYGILDLRTDAGLAAILGTDPDGVRRMAADPGGPTLAKRVAQTGVDSLEGTDRRIDGDVVRTYRFEIASPLLVGGAVSKDPGARSNLRRALSRASRPSIDGSTWKGIFRSAAEFIANSIGEVEGSAPDTSIIEALFGSTERRGLLRFSESEVHDSRKQIRHHVAIDRVTGGAREHKLFSDEPITAGSVTLTISSNGMCPDGTVRLLDAVAREIHDGYVGVGGATARGYGSLRVIDPDLGSPQDLTDVFFTRHRMEATNG